LNKKVGDAENQHHLFLTDKKESLEPSIGFEDFYYLERRIKAITMALLQSLFAVRTIF